MTKYIIDESTLRNLANAIRNVNGENKSYTPDEMIQAVTNIMNSVTYILTDQYGDEIPAVFVESKTVFDATANDIRIGTTAVTDKGITEGEKEIPSYHTSQGQRLIPAGSRFILPMQYYDYTKLQAVFCLFNTSLDDSVSAVKVALNDGVYAVQSTAIEASITVNNESGYVDFGITNTLGTPCVIKYFSYKEIY